MTDPKKKNRHGRPRLCRFFVLSIIFHIFFTRMTASERDEMIFFCRYYYADKIQSIADMLRISEATVRRELLRLRNELKEKLEKEGYTV